MQILCCTPQLPPSADRKIEWECCRTAGWWCPSACTQMRALRMSRACVLPTSPPSKLSLLSPGIPCQRLFCQAAQAGVQQAAHQGADDSQQAKHKQYPRFYCPQLPPAAGMSLELEPEEAKHAVRVLRLQAGDKVELCDGQGGLVQCEMTATSKSSAMLTAAAEPQHITWSGPKWVVAAACLTLKGGRTDWLVEKATELGAHSLLPLITAHSQTGTNKDKFKALAHKAGQNKPQRTAAGDGAGSRMHAEGGSEFQASRLERLAVAATKQSLRTHGLQVQPAIALDQLLPDLQAAPVSVVAMAGAPPILQVLQQQWQQAQQQLQQQQLVEAGGPPQACVAPEQQAAQGQQGLHQTPRGTHPWDGQACYILIGPEGDFTADEVARLSAAGVLPVGLGPHRLRTETAAIAALSAAVLLSESLGGVTSDTYTCLLQAIRGKVNGNDGHSSRLNQLSTWRCIEACMKLWTEIRSSSTCCCPTQHHCRSHRKHNGEQNSTRRRTTPCLLRASAGSAH